MVRLEHRHGGRSGSWRDARVPQEKRQRLDHTGRSACRWIQAAHRLQGRIVRRRPGQDALLGIGIVEPGVFELAARKPAPDLFGGLAPAALDAGMKLRIFEASRGDSWADAGEVERYRTGLLSCGSFVHPGALIEEGARLEGSWYVGTAASSDPGRGSSIRLC